MAHRTQFSKDLILPKEIQQHRVTLQKQIQKVRERQKLLIQQSNQRLLLLQHRLLHGKKKKIFTFDKQMNRMTLGDQIQHYNMEIAKLNRQIDNEQRAIRDSEENNDGVNGANVEEYLVKEVVLETTGMRKQAVELLMGNAVRMSVDRMSNQESIGETQRLSLRRSTSKQLRLTANQKDPQQQLMSLTHQIIRLKKSLQQVRSKYSQNFTEYKLKQQLQKLKAENEQIALELKQLQANKKIVHQNMNAKNLAQVDYDELEVVRARKECEILQRERNLLKEYWLKLNGERMDREESDERRVREWRQEKLGRLQSEVKEVKKHNEILMKEIELTDQQISRCNQYFLKLKGRIL